MLVVIGQKVVVITFSMVVLLLLSSSPTFFIQSERCSRGIDGYACFDGVWSNLSTFGTLYRRKSQVCPKIRGFIHTLSIRHEGLVEGNSD